MRAARRFALGVALLALAAVPGGAGAQNAPQGADAAVIHPASAAKVSYAALDALPDWRGIWLPQFPPFFVGPPEPAMKGAYKERYDSVRAQLAKGNSDAVETRSSACEPPAMPGVMMQPYNLEFLFTPGRVTIIQEAYMLVRRVYTDGRALPDDPDPTFTGSSIGHWEGDTLVVTTVGLKDGKSLGFPGATYSEGMKITERIRLAPDNPDHLVVDFTFEDPKALAEPWHRTLTFQRHREWDQIEYVCAENDRNPLDDKGAAGFVQPGK